MNRKLTFFMAFIVLILSLSGCKEASKILPDKERIVKTKTLEVQSIPETIYYFGFIEPTVIKSYALKTSGRVEHVYVKSGAYVEEGAPLVALDDYAYGLGVKVSSEQITLAKLDLEKARESRDFYGNVYNDSTVLYEEGVISKFKLDEIKLQFDMASKGAEQALKTLNQANIDYDFKSTSVADTSLVSDMKGYIVDVFYKEGELVAQGYPVVLVRSEDSVVKVGMTQGDVKRIKIGDRAQIESNGLTYKGVVSNINLMPDKLSRTYTVEVSVEAGEFVIGESCKVYIDLDAVEGIWLNITDIMNDGVDYVYVVENGRATRRDIILHEINKSLVRVTNLYAQDEVIISGKNSLSEGYKVKVEGDVDE